MLDDNAQPDAHALDAHAREEFQRADALFDSALDLDSRERAAYVAAKAGDDRELRDRVIALLVAHDQSAEFLEKPAAPDALMVRLQPVLGNAYRIRRRIAVGGMASVYLADDVRHQRRVAIKVFTVDEAGNGASANSLMSAERFLSEIRVMARLQHPNLLPLFDSGASAGLLYYVMPFVNGETLRDRLRQESPLPVDEALRLTHAIAGAVQHAHADGVVHRDLKPANVLLRDGQPLVADFGIALAMSDGNNQRMTQSGMLIGTAQYMSPEQASGSASIDARTDIYSLGAMLYEMLTGDPPHVASSAQGVIAKVRAERATSVHLLRDTIPIAVSQAVDRALAKLPADRFQSMREFDGALMASMATPNGSSRIEPHVVNAPSPFFARVAIAAVGVAAIVAIGMFALRKNEPSLAASRFVVAPLADAAIGRTPSITPDGTSLVYPGSAETKRRLFIRNVNELAAHPFAGTEGALSAFVSPDGKWIGFITTDDKLLKVSMEGGTPSVLAGVFRYSDGVWVGNDRIIISGYGQQGLNWTSSSGGALHVLTRLDTLRRESDHAKPFVLPDNRTVVFAVARDRTGPGPTVGELAVVTLDTTRTTAAPVRNLGIQSRGAVAYDNGWLMYVSADGLGIIAIRFDAETQTTHGEPVSVLEQADGGLRVASLASNGTLLYTRALDVNAPVVVDSTGAAKALLSGVTGSFMNPRLSPDGTHLAVQVTTKRGNDVWVYDVATATPLHITSSGSAVGPTWTADGKSVLFFSTSGGVDAAWRADASGTGAPERVVAATGLFALSTQKTRHELLFQRMIDGVWSVWRTDVADTAAANRVATPVIREKYDAFMPTLSPDGKWLAYAANESGRYEIYVRPFPNTGAAVQVSQGGGSEPSWSRDGRRIYFRGERRMFVATVATGAGFSVSNRRVLFTDAFDGDMPMPHRNYDLTHDGKFVMIAANAGDAPQTVVVLNWLQELRAKLAAAR